MDLRELERRLGGSLPRAYEEFVQSLSAQALRKRGFDPKTLLILNLELRSSDPGGMTKGRFFLSGDECGNYYFVELAPDATRVRLWSHDPAGVEDEELSLSSFLRTAEQTCRIDRPPPGGWLYVCRTPAYQESILDPIGLDEWIAALDATDGVEHVGYREGKNPFTREVIRVESPGLGLVMLGARKQHIVFGCGRAQMESRPELRVIATKLAEKLGARVVCRSD